MGRPCGIEGLRRCRWSSIFVLAIAVHLQGALGARRDTAALLLTQDEDDQGKRSALSPSAREGAVARAAPAEASAEVAASPAAAGAATAGHERSLLEVTQQSVATARSKRPSKALTSLGFSLKHLFHPEEVATATEVVTSLHCNETFFAPAEPCPSECPFLAETSERQCMFQCVPAEHCGTLPGLDSSAVVADTKHMTCQHCDVLYCEKCAAGRTNVCEVCSEGRHVRKGRCFEDQEAQQWKELLWQLAKYLILAGVAVCAFLGIWYVDLLLRPQTNNAGLHEAMAFRSRTALHLGPDESSAISVPSGYATHRLHPLSTNLFSRCVGGAGTLLHFNFQVMAIIWGVLIIYFTSVLAYKSGHTDLLTEGVQQDWDPRRLCEEFRFDANKKNDLLIGRCMELALLYVTTFGAAIGFALIQHIKWQELDDRTSMRDFAAFVKGLPIASGDQHEERELAQALEESTGQTVLGVSACWNYTKKIEEVNSIMEAELEALEKAADPARGVESVAPASVEREKLFGCFSFGAVRPILRVFSGLDRFCLKFNGAIEETASKSEEEIKTLLSGLSTTGFAFVVFETEQARDAAIHRALSPEGVWYKGSKLKLQITYSEPGTVLWSNFCARNGVHWRAFEVILGSFGILAALFLWTTMFYVPNVMNRMSNALVGEGPSVASRAVMSILVVLGNQAMYFVCDIISRQIAFQFEDIRQAVYNIFYFIAVLLNVLLDLCVEAMVLYVQMRNVHTADGRLLQDVTSLHEIFDSEPINQGLGALMDFYCFPFSFLVPFMGEGFGCLLIPYHLFRLLTVTNASVRHRPAERMMEFFMPMALVRYSDVLINMTLCTLMFFFPAAYTQKTILMFILSHIYIYFYDQYRVLRSSTCFIFSSNVVDQCAHGLMSVPVGLTLVCLVYRLRLLFFPEIGDLPLGLLLIAAFQLHLGIHTLLIVKFVPWLGNRGHVASKQTYQDHAATEACTWYNVNPVHCLRSKYVYKDAQPCVMYSRGKEHLLPVAPKAGLYFRGTDLMPHVLEERKKAAQIALREEEAAAGFSSPKTPLGASCEEKSAPLLKDTASH